MGESRSEIERALLPAIDRMRSARSRKRLADQALVVAQETEHAAAVALLEAETALNAAVAKATAS